MKKLLPLFLLVLFGCSLLVAQNKTDKFKIGLQFNPLLAANEFQYEERIKNSWLARGLVRFGLSEVLNAEIGAGYGTYQGLATNLDFYETTIIPADFRLLLKFTKTETYPYLFLGVGGLYYDVKDLPELTNPTGTFPKDVEKDGITVIVPAGLGVQIKLGSGVAMDLSAGVTISGTDNLNYYKEGDAFDAYYHFGLGFLFGSSIHDNDMDGLMSDVEEQLGTDPLNPDTDGDGLKDGDEVNNHKTDPLKADTDADGLKDGDEVTRYKTNPSKADTDGDGLKDGAEVNEYTTDPLKADTDGDGLQDGEEVTKITSDPLRVDTDGDGLQDGEEVNQFNTDPLKADTDADGLQDGAELNNYKTDPLKVDTDNGSVNDGAEVNRKTDPLNADDDVMKVGVAIVLEGITFATNSAEITPESEQTLQKALVTLNNNPDVVVEISGHTDNVGSNKSNKKLSQRRADSVKNWFIGKGIPGTRLIAIGYGEEKPIVSNDTPENRQKNRRIEFVRIK